MPPLICACACSFLSAQMGRAFSRKGEQGGLVEESGADFFLGVLVTESSPVAGLSIQAAGAFAPLLATAYTCQPARLLSSPRSSDPCSPARCTSPASAGTALQLALPRAHAGCFLNPYAGLRNLDGQYVTSVRRGNELVHAVGPEFMLATGDVLYLSGEQSRKKQLLFSVGASICWAGGSRLDTSAASLIGLFDHPTSQSAALPHGLALRSLSPQAFLTAQRSSPSWAWCPSLMRWRRLVRQTCRASRRPLVSSPSPCREWAPSRLPPAPESWHTLPLSSWRLPSRKVRVYLYQRFCSRQAAHAATPRYFADSSSSADQSLVPSLASLPAGSEIVGKSIRAAAFRSRFHAAVISIKRNGIPINWSSSQIGDEILRAEDRLLLDVAPQFWTEPEVNDAFTDLTKGGQVTQTGLLVGW